MDVACLLAKVKGVDVVLTILFSIIIPVAILVINVVVAIQVRRAAIHSAANLGVQPHHQSTSAVPTVMLITTSLIYVLFNVTATVLYVVMQLMLYNNTSIETRVIVEKYFDISMTAYVLIFAYNFYVYLITGKLFRSDLYKLLCRCSTSSSAPTPAPAPASAPAHALANIVAADDDADVARRVTADTDV